MENRNNLIALGGRSGSGKDLVGQIIQYLICLDKNTLADHQKDFEDFWRSPISNQMQSGWEIRKFASKLKDIVCLLIGCTREQLENADFKNKELGEEWWYYRVSTVPLSYIPYSRSENRYHEAILVKLTPRLLLQLCGTECGRDILHPNIWVNSLFADYKGVFRGGGLSDDDLTQDYPNWIITDLRFPNEKLAVEKHGGITIRISRPGTVLMDHPSETSLDHDNKWDYYIVNDSTIEDLIEKVRQILIHAKII